MFLPAPIHLAAGKHGSPYVHVLAGGAVVATNGTIVACYQDDQPTGESSRTYSTRPFRSAWADADDGVSIEMHKAGGIVRVTTESDETVATDYSRELVVDLQPIVDQLSQPVANATEVWLDAAQLAKLAKALGAGRGEPVKLTIPTTKGRGTGLVRVSRETAPEVRGAIMAQDEVIDPEIAQSALKPVTIPLPAAEEVPA